MGESEAARRKLESYDELDDPGHEPVPGGTPARASGYAESAGKTEHVRLDELEPVEPGWQGGRPSTEHLSLDDLEPAEERWDDAPQKTEAVDLDELEILEQLDPADANAPPALPEVGMRAKAPHAPLPVRRPTDRPPAKAKAKSTPPPPPRPPTRAESLRDAPRPMIGGEGWEPQGPVSLVDFSAVLTSPPPRRTDEETERISVSRPMATPPVSSAKPAGSGWSWGRALLVVLLVVGVGYGAYMLGRQGALPGMETVAAAEGEPTAIADDPPDDESALGEAVEEPAELDEEPAELDQPEAATAEPEEAPVVRAEPVRAEPVRAETVRAETMRTETMRTETRAPEPQPTRRATMAATTATAAEPTTMRAAPATMEASATMVTSPARETDPTMDEAPTDLPASPSREQVQTALTAVQSAVAGCMDGQHSTVRVRVTVRGSGRVTTAVVEDPYWRQPPYGSCIARAVRHARFPQFSDPSFVVLYPFQL